MNIIKVKNYEDMSEKACELIVDKLKKLEQPVLGLATGSTPEGFYDRLIDTYKEGNISFENTTTFNLDEYVGLSKDDSQSYHYYMNERLFKHINIKEENAHVPKGDTENLEEECKRYEQLIQDAGGVDLQLLGLGTNGHIAFNEPGSSFQSRTQVVDLTESTIQANSRFFERKEDVPTKAVSMGIGSILESDEIVMLVSGESKAEALAQMINGEITEDCPATALQNHNNVTVIADEAALKKVK
ncbi:MAG TPA: glucosamine-6-phosphate deaminase [Candidatus Avamphibacillus sp.]|nr:glucosamine-6-phosphate deaminase [Candidatus Avamphibacillus sp.]